MKDDIRKILTDMPEKKCSDLHISAGLAMHYRIDTELVEVGQKVLSGEDAKAIVYSLLTKEQIEKFEKEKELDFSFEIENVGRFRGNSFFQRGSVGCAIRLVPLKVMSISECGLPEKVVKSFCGASKGLVLVTGATGSGKSTTLAAMVEEINSNRKCHIVTVEDPIEFMHTGKKSIIDQRQVHEDTRSFANALRYVLRQDPDVILVGEMRDLETIQQALISADTGHLVLATLHTSDTTQSINRMIDVFPAHQQRQIRSQLSFVLLGILSQQLLPRKGQSGMALATEVLVATPAVRNVIRDSKEYQIYSIMQTSQKLGMQTMNQALADLYIRGLIDSGEAMLHSPNAEELGKMIG